MWCKRVIKNIVFNPKKVVFQTRTMKLLTHNMLTSKCMKGVSVGYPLGLTVSEVKTSEIDFNPDFVTRVIPKIDWGVLYNVAKELGFADELPNELENEWEKDESFLKKAHHVMLEIEVINGELTCPESGRKFPINNGIPNMLLNEVEVDLASSSS